MTDELEAEPPLESELATLAARYELLGETGRGSMGIVYRGRHRALEMDVAIKVILRGRSTERFLREGQVLARIRSPYVVAIHDLEILPGGRPVLVMEWVAGTNLAEVLAAGDGGVRESDAWAWMRQTCEGMLAAAEQGIVHRDLKPSNIIIDGQGRARVADFGLARLRTRGDPLLTAEASLMGTPLYMAPEQAEDPRGVDTRADIYSFGATFYHVLTGLPPFVAESYFALLLKHKSEPLVSPRARRKDLSARVSQLLERCLAKAPSDRFQSFAELLKHLEPTPPVSPWAEADDVELIGFLERYGARRAKYLRKGQPPGEMDVYQFPAGRTLRIVCGSILDEAADAIVSSDDEYLSMSGGVSRALLRAAGPDIGHEARRYVPVRPGRAVVTSGGKLGARFIFHAVTTPLVRDSPLRPSPDVITEVMASCFYHAETLNVRRIAFPLLGTGAAGLPEDTCLDMMFRYLARMLLRGSTPVQSATIVLFAQRRGAVRLEPGERRVFGLGGDES